MPRSLVRRAEEVLVKLESTRESANSGKRDNHVPTDGPIVDRVNLPSSIEEGMQMSFFKLDDPALEGVRDKLLDIDIDNLTPLEALLKLHEIRKAVGGK